MDIRYVRNRFQKEVDFFISNYVPSNVNQMYYSLQQDSTKMRYIQLYITCDVNPKLEGKHIRIGDQDYLVYKEANEPFSFSQWSYKLLVLTEPIQIKEVLAESNAIGGSKIIDTDGQEFLIDGDNLKIINGSYLAYLQDRIASDYTQVVSTSELQMLLPLSTPINPSGNYDIYYKGIKHKLKSITISFGSWVLKITKDV